MKYLQASYQENIRHIYILPECRVCEHLRGRNPADAEKTSEIALLSGCLFRPVILTAASDFVCCNLLLFEFFTEGFG